MKIIIILYYILFLFTFLKAEELPQCEWNNSTGKPCLTIFSAPNTSSISETGLAKTVITKKQIIESGYEDVRSVLEGIVGLDVYSDGPRGQKTSVFMRGTNSNHTLVLLNGIPINDQSSPKAMFDFGYDFLQGLQQIEIYKGASGAIFGPAAIGGAINFITDIDYNNSLSFGGSDSRNNSLSGNYTYITEGGWHHNIKGGSSQSEELSTQDSQLDLDGTKNLSLNYNSSKFFGDNLKLSLSGYARKTDSGYDSWDDENAQADNNLYALQTNLENRKSGIVDKFTSHIHVHDRYYDTAVKNKYYSQSYTFKGERKMEVSNNLSLGFGSDYNYTKGDFKIHGNWGSSAKGHMDNIGLYTNVGYKLDDNTFFSAHLRGDSHKYSEENLTYRLNLSKLISDFTFSLSESTGLRHPDLFVLHGSNPSGSFKSMKTTKAETSLTRELSVEYDFFENISFNSTFYDSSVSDVLNRSTSTGGYNEIMDIKQRGVENSLNFKNEFQKLSLTSVFSKSREGNGRPQLRRPEQQFGVKYSQKIKSDILGPFNLHYDYRHIGKVEDWKNGSKRAKVDSTDIMNLSLTKEINKINWSINITNLTDEIYERPDTYNQEGRKIGLSFRSKY